MNQTQSTISRQDVKNLVRYDSALTDYKSALASAEGAIEREQALITDGFMPHGIGNQRIMELGTKYATLEAVTSSVNFGSEAVAEAVKWITAGASVWSLDLEVEDA